MFAVIAVGLLTFANNAAGYFVERPVSLEKLSAEAHIIFKATVVSSRTAPDISYQPYRGFDLRETEFRIVSVIKGGRTAASLRFQHYDHDPTQPGMVGQAFEPQVYHFDPGQSYLVFAKQTGSAGLVHPLRAQHTMKRDLGVLRCANAQPVVSQNVKDVVWTELLALLQTGQAQDTIYGIRQLDQMSVVPDRIDVTNDFARVDVLKAVGPWITNAHDDIARAAILVIGSGNPYLFDDRVQGWLTTVGSVQIPGIGQMDPRMRNLGGEIYWQELSAIAGGTAPAATRALAIRSLGLVRNPLVMPALNRWRADAEPAVRAAAALLQADYPGDDALPHLIALAADPAPEVRVCAAHAIGFMQQLKLAGTLATLLADPDAKVRRAASLSLLSFSPKHEPIAQVFLANLENEEFRPLFLNALAREQPEAFLDSLAQAVEQKTAPRNWPGGQIPAFTAFNTLFKYLQGQPADSIRSGKFDRYLDALEKGYVSGSSEPRDIYAFYLQRGLTERAKRYRAAAKKAATFDLDPYFDQVDRNPSQYTR